MKQLTRDTAAEYDDFISVNKPTKNESEFKLLLGSTDDGPTIRPKPKDSEYPEEWQRLYVNFNNFDDYASFMFKFGQAPNPKLTQIAFTSTQQNALDKFFGD
jgi:hypothetical protein